MYNREHLKVTTAMDVEAKYKLSCRALSPNLTMATGVAQEPSYKADNLTITTTCEPTV
jgi:hypothetical protein